VLISLPLLRKRPLVLQPLPIPLNRIDFFAIIIRERVLHRLERGIRPMLLYPMIKFFFLLQFILAQFAPNTTHISPKGLYALTLAISPPNLLYTHPNTAFPANGPTNHPPTPQATTHIPAAMIGSNPNKIFATLSRSTEEEK
jgi:hypothetical protein